jgi:hypothetical protein
MVWSGVYQKRVAQLWQCYCALYIRLSIYVFRSCPMLPFLHHCDRRSDLKMPVEIAFFHPWELRVKLLSGKMRIQPITLNQSAFGHFLSQSFHKGLI